MRHTTDYPLAPPNTVVRSPSEGGSLAVYGLLAVSAFVGLVVVPGAALLALMMIGAAASYPRARLIPCRSPSLLESTLRAVPSKVIPPERETVGLDNRTLPAQADVSGAQATRGAPAARSGLD